MKLKAYLFVILVLLVFSSSVAAESRNLIHIKGSDTMIVVAQTWAEAYEHVNPDVTVSVGGGGSGTGINALLNGTVEVANTSRRMHSHEVRRARRLGMNPMEHVVGYDALAVFLHKNNPLKSLSLAQLAEIYGEGGKLRKWTDIGIEVPGCKNQEIVRVGRQNNSGTYVYFRNATLNRGQDYDFGIMDMLSSKDVVHLVEKTPCAIGYSGLAYATGKVKMACVERVQNQECVAPSVSSAVDGSYPIARPLFIYTNGKPTGAIKGYLDWILADAGQCIIYQKGYAPVSDVKCK